MTTINITDFKRNIWTYFDDLISKKEPLVIQRRKHLAIMISIDDLTKEDIETIQNMKNKNIPSEVFDKDWSETFSKISGQKLDKVILW